MGGSFERCLSFVLYTTGPSGSAAVRRSAPGALLGMVNMFVQSLDVVMMGMLRFSPLRLVANNRLPVLAERAVHVCLALPCLLGAIEEDIEQERVRLQMGRGQNLEIGPGATAGFHLGIDSFEENAGEQEIGLHDDAAKARALTNGQGIAQERRGDAGKGNR